MLASNKAVDSGTWSVLVNGGTDVYVRRKVSVSFKECVLVSLALLLLVTSLCLFYKGPPINDIHHITLKAKAHQGRIWPQLIIIDVHLRIRRWGGEAYCISKKGTAGEIEMGKKSSRFQGCCENALIQCFQMSPHLIVWRFHPLPFCGQPLDRVWRRAGHKRVWRLKLQSIK